MTNRKQHTLLLLLFVIIIGFGIASGCASNKYMLDEPVNDPIMSTDDQQDSDLCKVEDGGNSGAGGECPT